MGGSIDALIPGFEESGIVVTSFLFLNVLGAVYLFDYEQVLCILDTLISRQLVCIYAGIAVNNIYTPTCATLLKCYQWGDDLLAQFSNKAYALIKYWEPIILGSLISKIDSWGLRTDFLNNMKEDYLEN